MSSPLGKKVRYNVLLLWERYSTKEIILVRGYECVRILKPLLVKEVLWNEEEGQVLLGYEGINTHLGEFSIIP